MNSYDFQLSPCKVMMILLNLKIKRDNVEGWHPAQPLVNLDIGSESFLKILIIRRIKKNKQIEKQPKLCKYFWIFCVHANLLLSWRSDGFLNSIIKASHSCFKITFYGEFQTKGDRAAWRVHACTSLSVSVCQLMVSSELLRLEGPCCPPPPPPAVWKWI